METKNSPTDEQLRRLWRRIALLKEVKDTYDEPKQTHKKFFKLYSGPGYPTIPRKKRIINFRDLPEQNN